MVRKFFVAIFIFVVSLEILLRLTGLYITSSERAGEGYLKKYRAHKPTWFHTWTPNTTTRYTQTEFEYVNVYNDLGHRESNILNFLKDTLHDKIICLGDSFTEGDGAPADSTWVKSLEKSINELKNNNSYRFYNAGVCGSDVFYNNKMLTEKLVKANPKIVIECVNFSDITDIIYRGGKERFNSDGTTTGKVGPRWELLYQYSHVFRAIVHFSGYDHYLLKVDDPDAAYVQYNKSKKIMEEQIEENYRFCCENGIRYVLVLHPTFSLFVTGTNIQKKYKYLDSDFCAMLSDKSYTVNLFNPLTEYYSQHDIKKYSWEINRHFNSKGYYVMGDIIFRELLEKGVIY